MVGYQSDCWQQLDDSGYAHAPLYTSPLALGLTPLWFMYSVMMLRTSVFQFGK